MVSSDLDEVANPKFDTFGEGDREDEVIINFEDYGKATLVENNSTSAIVPLDQGFQDIVPTEFSYQDTCKESSVGLKFRVMLKGHQLPKFYKLNLPLSRRQQFNDRVYWQRVEKKLIFEELKERIRKKCSS